ncbi:MAG: PKD domain-containing protein [Pseudomonadota bacterium]
MLSTLRLTILTAALCAPLASQAATPASGTLSPATPELTYTYGPNAVSNPSGTAELTCANPVVPCDAYALTVEVPAGSPAMTMTISTGWSAAADDYDIYLLNAEGVEAGSSAGSANPETFTVPAVSGTYTVRVVPFAVTGSTANTTITLQAAAAGGGGGGMTPGPVVVPAAGLAPRYKIHVATGGLAPDSGEPTIGYNPLTKRAMFIAYFQANRVTFKENLPAPADALNAALPESCDALWEDKSGLLTTLNSLDPLMYTDKTTGRTFNSQLSGANSLFEYSDDDGETWTPGQIGPANGGADHQGMVTGPYPASFPIPAAARLFPNAFYYCSQSVAVAFCARSDDGGQTQGPGTPFKNLDCAAGGLHGHPQVAPDGTLYIPDSSQCIASTGIDGSSGKVIVHRSLDAGLTYEQFPLPESTGGGGSDPSIGIATDGTMYMCYENADSRARMAVSKDRGETWINDTDIGAAAGLIATRFPAATAGDPDRAACAFLGTATEGPSASLAFTGVWHGYIATTYDGGLTYHLVNVTPNDPIQGHGGVGPDGTNRNLLDFNDLEIDERGRVLFAYADGCVGGCVLDPAANSFAAKGSIVRQSGGRTLLAEFDNDADTQYNATAPIRPAAACAVQEKSLRTSAKTLVAWNEPDTGGSAVTNYEVFRATSAAGPYASVGNAGPKTSFEDASADPSVPLYYYRVVAENAQGKAGDSNIIELPISVEEVINTCVIPGQVIATSAISPTLPPDFDAVSLAVAEPPDFEGKLVVTLKLASFATGQPVGAFYGVLFPNKGNIYFALDSTNGPASFVQGTYTVGPQGVLVFAPAGDLDPASGFEADGTVTFVVDKAFFGGLEAGDVLSGFDVRIRAGASAATSRDTIGPADYVVRGTGICLANIAPIASLASNVNAAKPGETVTFTISGSDADAGDTIAKFSLSFGDNTAAITDRDITSLPVTITHTYAANGNYMARLTVKDSRGLVSSNVASKFINISGTGSGTPVITPGGSTRGSEQGRFGGGALGLALLPLALLAFRRRRH